MFDGGERVLPRAPSLRPLLHGLILGRGQASRRTLYKLLSLDESERLHVQRFSQHVYTLNDRWRLGIHIYDERVVLDESRLEVDLWQLIEWTEKGTDRSLAKARKLLEERRDLCTPQGFDECEDKAWGKTFTAFERARELAFALRPAGVDAGVSLRAARDALLEREVAPGAVAGTRLRDVAELAHRVKGMRSPPQEEVPRPVTIADRLEGPPEHGQARIVLVGGPGAGKTVTAMLTFLELAERFESAEEPELVPLYVDGFREGFDEDGFGDDEWLGERLAAAGIDEGREPIVVFGHADAFLAHVNDRSVLSRGVFRAKRLLLCCSQTFYDRRLVFKGLAADRVELSPWPRLLQEDFAEVALGSEARAGLAAWLDEDPAREELCAVPLHLVFVLDLLRNPDRVPNVSTAGRLFEEVAWVRFGHAAGADTEIEDRLALLGNVAHHFYPDAKATIGAPFRFERDDLRALLASCGGDVGEQPSKWADELEHHTLLISNDGRGTLSFEHPIWAQFFVARHIERTLIERSAQTLSTFSKFLSLEVASFCEELLAGADLGSVRQALGGAITADPSGIEGERVRIAHEQVCYFFGALGSPRVREELLEFVDPDSDLFEEDEWIRRGVLFGLADGGDERAADMYVDALRAERDAGGCAARDTNIGFHLSFRGDQEFDVERPDAIADDPECERTVAGLVRGLGQERHAGSRRIKLFTLLELAEHPQIPRQGFEDAIEPQLGALAAIAERLAADPTSASWPELPELERLLREHRGRS